ncbi:hypothetical protein NP493_296g01008 [Ridgeia piscesae]|uniref:Uncharacterized protein n=1 Tax=Ridgeia piscesae TaxID=27915 RepID=A0AAD9NWH8_RIDPI|nr:hypothetical protein NP493_296g01008 [Ridgeia piscesae]
MDESWWQEPIAEDIYRNLRLKEKHLPVYYAQSPQIGFRRYLVDWLSLICDVYQISSTARYLTVALLDYFMDRFDVDDQQLRLVALGSLLVAAKFEEHEVNIPKSHDLNSYVPPPGYAPRDYMHMELTLLDSFAWNVCLPTPAHFTDYFLLGLVQELQRDKGEEGDVRSWADGSPVMKYLGKYVTYFLEISMQDHIYRNYLPSLVATACIASSRWCLHITPPWTGELENLSGYTWDDLHPLVQNMLSTHHTDEQLTNKQCPVSTFSASSLTDMSPPRSAPASPVHDKTPVSTMPSGVTMCKLQLVTTTAGQRL